MVLGFFFLILLHKEVGYIPPVSFWVYFLFVCFFFCCAEPKSFDTIACLLLLVVNVLQLLNALNWFFYTKLGFDQFKYGLLICARIRCSSLGA